ncbi:hypothetical protein C8T65DRAFT_678572 [Cerioporus squamosus]|nr:hypothetical protein C8T65DRAFT_678572 [Cerioporus squamosus]
MPYVCARARLEPLRSEGTDSGGSLLARCRGPFSRVERLHPRPHLDLTMTLPSPALVTGPLLSAPRVPAPRTPLVTARYAGRRQRPRSCSCRAENVMGTPSTLGWCPCEACVCTGIDEVCM